MPVVFYDDTIAHVLRANVNLLATVNVALTNSAFFQANKVVGDLTLAANTAGVRMNNPTLTLATGNVVWAGDAATVTATGAAYAANAVWYSDAGPKYLIAHYILTNATALALNDTFSIFCNQGVANIGDPNN
jgi:hypothetical protein